MKTDVVEVYCRYRCVFCRTTVMKGKVQPRKSMACKMIDYFYIQKKLMYSVIFIQIIEPDACDGKNPHVNALCGSNIDALQTLNLFSLADHSQFCLAYLFTFRDFAGGLMGSSWMASSYPGAFYLICILCSVLLHSLKLPSQ